MPRDRDRITIPDGDDGEIVLPSKWEICSFCNGEGKHSQHIGAITQTERERDWDEESWETYMRGGYDKRCEECDGTGKVRMADLDRMTPEQKAQWHEWATGEAEYRAQCEMERRMGA